MERPILFSTLMVHAILEGRKTQTRRIIKPQGKAVCFDVAMHKDGSDKWPRNLDADERFISDMKCPYGNPGDILWVRETWRDEGFGIWTYKADDPESGGKWTPSIFMPKYASRIKLLVKDIRVERLQDISEEDAKGEGCEKAIKWIHTGKIEVIDSSHVFYKHSTYKDGYEMLWESINGKESYKSNPWVWVITF